jgi:hypothetical protein
MTRTGSDHIPLLIDFGCPAHIGKNSHFSFELSWLRQEDFFDLVKREWCSVDLGNTPVDKWQNKVRHLW